MTEQYETTTTFNPGLNKDYSILFILGNDGEILKISPNGDIFVKGKLIENDKEVVDALREFLTSQGFINL